MIQDVITAAASGNEVPTYLGSAMAIMYAQRALKSRQFYKDLVKSVPGADKWAHRLVAAVGSLAAVGIITQFDYDPDTGGKVILTLPPALALFHAAKDFLFTYAGQQALYDATYKAPGAVIAASPAEGGTV